MVSRRNFLKVLGSATGTAAVSAVAGTAGAEVHGPPLDNDRVGMLIDTTECIGCRRCEWACARQNDLPHGDLESYDDTSVFAERRRPSDSAFTVVNRYEPLPGRDKPLDVKIQCMHCEHPACVSACIVGALQKNPKGPVTYDAGKCIGCRYCMVACPFQIPAYEFHDQLTPRVMKCSLCSERTLAEGKLPACVEICPREALFFGPRDELVTLAWDKIRNAPDRYVQHVYGQHEAGGTSVLMLADRDFQKVELPDLPDKSPATITESIQHGIFRGFSGPIMLFGLMAVLMKSSSDKRKEGEDDDV